MKWAATHEMWEFSVKFKDGNGYEHEDTCARPRLINLETKELETETEARKSIIYERQQSGYCVCRIDKIDSIEEEV